MALLHELAKAPRQLILPPCDLSPRLCQNPRCITAQENRLPPLIKPDRLAIVCGYCDSTRERGV